VATAARDRAAAGDVLLDEVTEFVDDSTGRDR
jgi:hypothetical protein